MKPNEDLRQLEAIYGAGNVQPLEPGIRLQIDKASGWSTDIAYWCAVTAEEVVFLKGRPGETKERLWSYYRKSIRLTFTAERLERWYPSLVGEIEIDPIRMQLEPEHTAEEKKKGVTNTTEFLQWLNKKIGDQ